MFVFVLLLHVYLRSKMLVYLKGPGVEGSVASVEGLVTGGRAGAL